MYHATVDATSTLRSDSRHCIDRNAICRLSVFMLSERLLTARHPTRSAGGVACCACSEQERERAQHVLLPLVSSSTQHVLQ